MSASAWTDDRVGRLKTLWREGQTAEQISRDLANGISRSAVLGKIHRLGLSASRSRVSKTLEARSTPASTPRRPHAAIRPFIEPDVILERGFATLQTVGRHQCRWPLGDPAAPDFILCGQPVARGVYCRPHGDLAYRPARETAQSLERLARLN